MNPIYSSIHPAQIATAPIRVVLHPSHKNPSADVNGEWVTHLENMESGGFFWGHYFDSYSDAKADYIARCAKENVASGFCVHCGEQHSDSVCRANISA